ncbi:tol-pal system protein YbgF [Rickettsiaceae bacterium]|nr:tol-pal system protein YbgF [Rickettsiaceae bacterium]
MNRVIFLLCTCVVLLTGLVFPASASRDTSYTSIIQKQSKKIQELNNRVSALEETVKKLIKADEVPDDSDDTDTKTEEDDSPVSNDDTADSGNKSSNDLEKDRLAYDLALAALKEGDYEASESQFAEFIDKYPLSKLQGNATFWYAESFYHRGLFDKAAIFYLRSYKKHPKSSKASDALLKLSYSLASMGKKEQACNILQKLESEFPNRSIDSIKRTKEAKESFLCE